MLCKIFCLTFSSAQGGFDDEVVREFVKDKEIIAINDHLFTRNEIPYLTLIIKYYPYRTESETKAKTESNREEAWRSLLSEADMGLFNLLRDWRAERCKKDGVPPYVIFTNQQLAMIVKKRPQSNSELTQIEGIGSGKVQKYAEEVLKISKKSKISSEEDKGSAQQQSKTP